MIYRIIVSIHRVSVPHKFAIKEVGCYSVIVHGLSWTSQPRFNTCVLFVLTKHNLGNIR